MIKAVAFDIGETLIDDTREWGAWADWIGIPRHTFSAVVGALVASGGGNRETFHVFRPGFDVAAERVARERAGCGQLVEEADLYPDVRPALASLRQRGFWVVIAGNQSAQVGQCLRDLRLPADVIATSEEWGVGKPDRAFFKNVVDACHATADEILYVGDHRDYDITAGRVAGLHTALIRRGPWGHLWWDDPTNRANADVAVTTLLELTEWLSTQHERARRVRGYGRRSV